METKEKCPSLRSLFDDFFRGGVLSKSEGDHVARCVICQKIRGAIVNLLIRRTHSVEKLTPEDLDTLFDEWSFPHSPLRRLVKNLRKKRSKSK